MGNTSVREKDHHRHRYNEDSGPTIVGKRHDDSASDGLASMKVNKALRFDDRFMLDILCDLIVLIYELYFLL